MQSDDGDAEFAVIMMMLRSISIDLELQCEALINDGLGTLEWVIVSLGSETDKVSLGELKLLDEEIGLWFI